MDTDTSVIDIRDFPSDASQSERESERESVCVDNTNHLDTWSLSFDAWALFDFFP